MAEEQVRAAWKGVELHDSGMTDDGGYYISIAGFPSAPWRGHTQEEAWRSALDFTNARQEKIRQVEEEIEVLEVERETCAHIGGCEDQFPLSIREEMLAQERMWSRILAREQQVLANLQRGMKPSPGAAGAEVGR